MLSSSRNEFETLLCEFAAQHSVNVNVLSLKLAHLLESATTKEKRKQMLEKFFKTVFSEVGSHLGLFTKLGLFFLNMHYIFIINMFYLNPWYFLFFLLLRFEFGPFIPCTISRLKASCL